MSYADVVTEVPVVEKPVQRSVPKANTVAVVAGEMPMNMAATRASAPIPKRSVEKMKNTPMEKLRSIRTQQKSKNKLGV